MDVVLVAPAVTSTEIPGRAGPMYGGKNYEIVYIVIENKLFETTSHQSHEFSKNGCAGKIVHALVALSVSLAEISRT